MPKASLDEIREDVIRVFEESDASVAQVAEDFGIWPSCSKRWLMISAADYDGATWPHVLPPVGPSLSGAGQAIQSAAPASTS